MLPTGNDTAGSADSQGDPQRRPDPRQMTMLGPGGATGTGLLPGSGAFVPGAEQLLDYAAGEIARASSSMPCR